MKKSFKLFFAAALVLAAASCKKDELAEPEKTRISDGFVDVEFNAVLAEPTKATLTPNEDETLFTPGWENGDAIKVYYSANSTDGTVDATWNAGSHSFTATLPEYKGAWDYKACYPAFDANRKVAFGSSRTQDGNKFNSAYDIMTATASATNADAGKDNDGNPIVFNFERKTAIQYFHFTSDNTSEKITKATLTIDGGSISNSDVTIKNDYDVLWGEETGSGTIEVTFTNAPSASDFQLWFNVKPTEYTSVILTVETETKTYTLCNITSGEYEAGKLYKVKKENIVWDNKTSSNTKKLLFSFKTYPNGWPVKASAEIGNYTYTLNSVEYTFTHTKSGNGIYCSGDTGTDLYLMICKDNKLGLPTVAGHKLVSVAASNSSGCSQVVSVSVTNAAEDKIGASQTWSTKSSKYNYLLSDTDVEEVYYLTINDANAQITSLILSYEPATARTPQNLSFSQTACIVADDETFTEPTLSGVQTTVTYTSSNIDVATVDATSGDVTIVAAGTTVITATAASSETYKKGTASYTLTVTPTEVLTTMDQIFEKATAVGSTETPVKVTLGNWVVSGVKGSNAYVTDGTKGFIIYTNNHGFAVGDKLSGTVNCNVQLYYKSAEITGLTSTTTGLTKTAGGSITPQEVSISNLGGVNTGAVITVNNVTFDGTNLVDANSNAIQPYNSLFSYSGLTIGVKYNVTGVYCQFKDTKEVFPRNAADIVEAPATKYTITISESIENGTVTPSRTEAAEGTQITLTATPASGYKLDSWDVKDASSNPITVTDNKFTMPASAVTVSATFEIKEGGPVYTLVESLSNITAGTYCIAALNSGKYYTVPNTTISGQTFTCTEATVLNKVITTLPNNAGIFEFKSTGTANQFYIYNTTLEKYLVATGSKTFGYVDNTSSDYGYWTFSAIDGGGFSGVFSVKHLDKDSKEKSQYMRAYNNSVRCYDGTSNKGIYLFKAE